MYSLVLDLARKTGSQVNIVNVECNDYGERDHIYSESIPYRITGTSP